MPRRKRLEKSQLMTRESAHREIPGQFILFFTDEQLGENRNGGFSKETETRRKLASDVNIVRILQTTEE